MHSGAEIAITGLGLVTALGLSPEEVFGAILSGRESLRRPMSALEQRPVNDKGGGQAPELPPNSRARAGRESRHLRFTIEQALNNARIIARADRVAVVMGTTLHGMRAAGRFLRNGRIEDLHEVTADAVLRTAVDGLGVGGAAITTCSACSSGLAAVALGATLLRSGDADVVITGGYDPVSEYAYAGFDSLRLVALGAPRPFAADRDGMKIAEGYAALVLERGGDAQSRGARVRGYLCAVGDSADAHHLTQPHPEGDGAARAIRAALAEAGIAPDDVGMISAHATSTPNNDAAEYAALAAVFGEQLKATPVTAFKSHVGHTLGAAGAVELVLAVLSHESGLIPPVASVDTLDPAFAKLDLVRRSARTATIGYSLNLSLGFGGANAAAVVSTRPARRPHQPRNDDAVITGVGVVLPGSVGNAAYRARVCSADDVLTGPMDYEAIGQFINARRVRRMSDYVKLTIAATAIACDHAGLAGSTPLAADASCILATLHGAVAMCESYYGQIVREGMEAANPVLFAEGVPNAAAAQLSLLLGIRGGCQTLLGSRTAGLDALWLATLRVREGRSDRVFVGAGEEQSALVTEAYASCRGDMGEAPPAGSGAVTFIVESRRAAARRKAPILAVIEDGSSHGGKSPSSLVHNVQRLGPALGVITSLGATQGERAAIEHLRRETSARVWSTGQTMPELFSVAPLACLAGLLLAGHDHPAFGSLTDQRCVIAAANSRAGSTALRLRLDLN